MKKIAKALTSLLLLVGLMSVCGVFSSCRSNDTMYTPRQSKSKVIKTHYKVRHIRVRGKEVVPFLLSPFLFNTGP